MSINSITHYKNHNKYNIVSIHQVQLWENPVAIRLPASGHMMEQRQHEWDQSLQSDLSILIADRHYQSLLKDCIIMVTVGCAIIYSY